MAEYKGLSGKSYTTKNVPFAGGGEGDIYDIAGAPEHVIKIYQPDKRTTERERKLSFMVSRRPSVMEQYAWPLDVVYENGRFAGYLMPKISGKKKLRDIYVYDQRKGNPWSLYVAIAKNLSAAVHNVHEIHQTVGDLNPENILVSPSSGMVTLVDTDSYHISDSGRTYRCMVGMPEFVAPELQGIHFPSAPLPTYTAESDRFALAVLIFALLMNGSHPFACKLISGSSSKFQPLDNMQNGKCAFFPDSRSGNMTIPKYAPELSALPEAVQKLFRRAFVEGLRAPALRPSAEEWYRALESLEDNLKACLKNPQHIYCYSAKECPWCKVDAKMRSISQSAFQNTSQSGSGSGSPAGGQTSAPSGYRYTPSPGSTKIQKPKKRKPGRGLLIAAVVFTLVLVLKLLPDEKDSGPARQTGAEAGSPAGTTGASAENVPSEPAETMSPLLRTDSYIHLSQLDCINQSESGEAFAYYDTATDSFGTTYQNAIGGTDGYGQSWKEYRLDGTYSELRGRVALNYDARTQDNEGVYLWIYGDNINLFLSQEVKAGCEPQDFTVDLTGVSVLKVAIQGKSMLRLVDCGLYTSSSVPTVSTASQTAVTQQNRIYLSDLDWFNASRSDGGFLYFTSVKDNFGTAYANGIGGSDGYGKSFQEYRLNGAYAKMQGRVVLNYDVRTQVNEDVYLWIYGDGALLFQSQNISAGCEPQDFTVDLTGVTTLKVVIQGTSMLRLVDCILSKGDAE